MFCEKPTQMSKLIARMPKSLKPVRVITESHILEKEFWRVAVPFSDKEFGAPILETYEGEGTYYGIYDRAGRDSETSIAKSLTRAEEFFELVARAAQGVVAVKKNDRVFPRVENRKAVQKHLTRERAASLARERKVRDNYECQVCGFRFEAIYGDIGSAYAEAHHRVPLSHLKGRVRTTIDDLVTVCANCHRMLHQMEGRKTDVATLRRRIRSSVK